MPQRIGSLHETILSVLHQADKVNVYLNEFSEIPDFLYHPKIFFFKSQHELGDLGDVGKFFKANTEKVYLFFIDDDIIYPKTYAADLIGYIERFKRKAVISLHGRILPDRPVKSYYKDFLEVFPCLQNHRESFIHIAGTGVMALHSDTFTPEVAMFETSNMADIWLSAELQKRSVPIFCPASRKGYIKDSNKYNHNYSIARFCCSNDSFQTDVVNKHVPWKLHAL